MYDSLLFNFHERILSLAQLVFIAKLGSSGIIPVVRYSKTRYLTPTEG
jgi:hypothetical protein